MLTIQALSKRLAAREILRDINLDAMPGQTVALFGQNGAGKSTLLRILAGVLDTDIGRATLDGESLLGSNAKARIHIGFVPEAGDAPPHLSPRQLVALVASLKRAALPADSLFERLGVEPFADQPFAGLSLGQRRRSCLATALVGNVKLLLLDEPTNGLDANGVRLLADVIEERAREGTISLVATHDESFAAMIHAKRLRLVQGQLSGDS